MNPFPRILTLLIGVGLWAGSVPVNAIGLKRSEGGGSSRASAPRPKPAARPAPKPASKPKPAYRPESKPSQPSRPSGGGSGNGGGRLPSAKPSPDRPSTRPSVDRPSVSRPENSRPDIGYRPQQRPSLPENRPSIPENRPSTRPGGGNDLGLRPSDRPTTLPAQRPGEGNRPGLPDRPSTLPARPGGMDRPNLADRPTTLPARPGDGSRPDFGNRPHIPDPPGRPARPERPDWGGRWDDSDNRFTGISSQWNSNNQTVVNNFNVNRHNEWNVVNQRWNQPGWHSNWGSPAYHGWRHDVWGYRGHRCHEVWYRTGPFHYHNHFFNVHWWGSCWWHPRPLVYRYSPWWWWRPVVWTSVGFFFGQAIASDPIVYDPGTTVIYEGDTIYINGQSAGSATEYRQQTIALANPAVAEIPVPTPPPVPDGVDPETAQDDPAKPQGDWLPMGAWALTQQEQGDATMFFQISIDKNGIVGGAYKNVMTGDEQPVVGKLDFQTQRVAWHIGDVTTTVYETGLSNFENDVASVFVHFGDVQTQTWLLVRMPSPEMPPGTVKLPEIPQP